jgi:hypothetical protein
VESGIRTVATDKDEHGDYTRVRLVFGPHYFVELHREQEDGVTFVLSELHTTASRPMLRR